MNEPAAAQIVDLIHRRMREVGVTSKIHVLKNLCRAVENNLQIKLNLADFSHMSADGWFFRS